MNNVGDRKYRFLNSENSLSLLVTEVYDIYEVSLIDTVYDIRFWLFCQNMEFGQKLDGKYNDGGISLRMAKELIFNFIKKNK